uniref:C2 domain-containing protein n=1 Tax=Crocodylus porosus TaxID=8502 RepID=A0A7M4EI37_CROPO
MKNDRALGEALEGEDSGGDCVETVEEAANDSPGSPGCGSPPNRTVLSRASLSSYPFSQTLKLPSMLLEGWEHRRNTSSNSIFYNEHRPLTSPVQGASLHQSYTVPENLSSTSSKPQPQLHFTLLYSQSEATLTVTVIGVSHLPKVSRSSHSSYVKVYLLPRFIEPQRTAVRRKSLNPEFQEQFQFGRYSLEELRRFTLRFAVYMKARSLKDLFIGEVMFPCAQVTWNPKHQTNVSYSLVPLSESLNSPVPDHYIVIHLYHDGKIIDTKETKGIAGYNPVWNTPFLFSIPAGDIQQQQLSLEFIVMQVGWTGTRMRDHVR